MSIPADIADLVEAVLGLDQRRAARRHATKPTATVTAKPPPPFRPADIEQHYNFPAGDCAGQKVGIAEFGQVAYFPDDVAYFCMYMGRGGPNVNAVPVNTLPLTALQYFALPDQVRTDVFLPDIEVALDVQIVAALCPAAQISVYYATSDANGWYSLIDQVVRDRPAALSISWGAPEDIFEDQGLFTPAGLQQINGKLKEASLAGITVCASAGDDASSDGEYGRPGPRRFSRVQSLRAVGWRRDVPASRRLSGGNRRDSAPPEADQRAVASARCSTGRRGRRWMFHPSTQVHQGADRSRRGRVGGPADVLAVDIVAGRVSTCGRRHQRGGAGMGFASGANQRSAAGRQAAALHNPAALPEQRGHPGFRRHRLRQQLLLRVRR